MATQSAAVTQEVTDPALLEQLNSMEALGQSQSQAPQGTAVTDADTIAQLEARAASMLPSDPRPVLKEEETVAWHALNRIKRGLAGSFSFGALAGDLVLSPLEIAHAKGKKTLFGVPTVPPLHAMTKSREGWELLLDHNDVPMPTDIYGHKSKAHEYIGMLAEFSGGGAMPGSMAVAAARRKLATSLVMAGGNVASATTAVELGAVGEQQGPTFGLSPAEGRAVGEMVGGFLGTGIVAAGTQKVLAATEQARTRAADLDIGSRDPAQQKLMANGQLMREIEDSLIAHPQHEENVKRALDLVEKNKTFSPVLLAEKNKTFSPVLAMITDSPGIKAMYAEVANKSPEALAKAHAIQQRNIESIRLYGEAKFGSRPLTSSVKVDDPYPLTSPAKTQLEMNQFVIQQRMEATAADLAKMDTAFERSGRNEAIGEELRGLYWQQREKVKQASNAELQSVYATAQKFGVRESMTDMREMVEKITSSDKNTFQTMPIIFQKILAEYPVGTPATMTRTALPLKPGQVKPSYEVRSTKAIEAKESASFEELHSLYRQANKDWHDAVISGDANKAHYLKAVRDQMQVKVQKYDGAEYGELGEKFRQYNGNYKQYAEIFKEKTGGMIEARTKRGLVVDSEDLVVKTVLMSSDKSLGVKQFLEIYGDNPRSAELLHDGLLDNFSKAVMAKGEFDAVAAQKWMRQHSEVMRELPETAKIFGDAAEMNKRLVNRRLELTAEAKAMDKTLLARIAKHEQPDVLIREALESNDMMQVLKGTMHTPEAKRVLARSIMDNVSKREDGLEFLMSKEAQLRPVMESLGKGHWQNLKDIAEMESIVARVKPPTAVELAKIQDLGEKTIGTSVKGLLSRSMGAARGFMSTPYVILDVTGRYAYKIKQAELVRLREQAIFDPDVAGILSQLGKRATYTKKELLDLNRIGFNAGVVSVVQAASVETPQETREESAAAAKRAREEGVGKWRKLNAPYWGSGG